MRSAANFTLHAILAACLAALAASSAAAAKPLIDNEGHAFLSFELLGPGAKGGKGEQLEVQSYHWGPRQTTSADGSKLQPGGGASGGGAQVAASHEVKPPRDASLGSASERRNYAPVTFSTPRDRGSLTVQGQLAGCEVGKRYAGAQFASAGMSYELKEVIISGCAANSVSLDYAKVTVRGWDPATK